MLISTGWDYSIQQVWEKDKSMKSYNNHAITAIFKHYQKHISMFITNHAII